MLNIRSNTNQLGDYRHTYRFVNNPACLQMYTYKVTFLKAEVHICIGELGLN